MSEPSYQERARQLEQEIDEIPMTEKDVEGWTEEDWKDYLEWMYDSYNRPVDYGFDTNE